MANAEVGAAYQYAFDLAVARDQPERFVCELHTVLLPAFMRRTGIVKTLAVRSISA